MSEIRETDPSDEALLRRLWEIGAAADAETPQTHDHESWPMSRHRWTTPVAAHRVALLHAVVGHESVGYAEIDLPSLDNTHLAEVCVYVDAAHRREGHGSALLEAATSLAAGSGRSVLMTGFAAIFDGTGPGESFAIARGFELAQWDVEKILDIAAHAAAWPRLLAEVEGASAAYRVESFAGPCPDELLPALCSLASGFNGEIPLGALDLEDERWDERRFRERDVRNAATGRREVTTLALGPRGEPAGYTVIFVDEGTPGIGYQDATLVVGEHRGHRLGLRLKLVNQLLATRLHPQVHTLETGNAVDNQHMAAVNDLLGFRAVGRWLEMQKRCA